MKITCSHQLELAPALLELFKVAGITLTMEQGQADEDIYFTFLKEPNHPVFAKLLIPSNNIQIFYQDLLLCTIPLEFKSPADASKITFAAATIVMIHYRRIHSCQEQRLELIEVHKNDTSFLRRFGWTYAEILINLLADIKSQNGSSIFSAYMTAKICGRLYLYHKTLKEMDLATSKAQQAQAALLELQTIAQTSNPQAIAYLGQLSETQRTVTTFLDSLSKAGAQASEADAEYLSPAEPH